jgi:3-hydroxybutyrate dehydrogenase
MSRKWETQESPGYTSCSQPDQISVLAGTPIWWGWNAICPGFVLTPLVEKQIEAQIASTGLPRERVVAEIILAKHAIKRFVTVEEIADSVAFLCSESAASVTGAAWAIDAGWTAA